MIFIKLHNSINNESILINLDNVNSIYPIKKGTEIHVGDVCYQVKENYDEIEDCIIRYFGFGGIQNDK